METRPLRTLVYNKSHEKDFLVDYLQGLGYYVIEVPSSEKFAETLITDKIEAAVIDILPGPTIAEQMVLLEYLKENAPKAYRVVVTENTSEIVKIQAYERGAELYYIMPITTQELIYQLQMLDNYRRTYKPSSVLEDLSKVSAKQLDELDLSSLLPFGNYTYDVSTEIIYSDTGRPLMLAHQDFLVFKRIAGANKPILSKPKFIREFWSADTLDTRNCFAAAICRINKAMSTCTLKITSKSAHFIQIEPR